MKNLLIIVFVFPVLFVEAQKDTSFVLSKTISGDFSYFTTDNLDNIYLLTAGNQLKKISPFPLSASLLFLEK